MKHIFKFLGLATLVCIWSCGSNENKLPDPEIFAPYVKSFSGSMIPEGRPVTVSLIYNIVSPEEEPLFEFSPEIKGSQIITDGSTAQFLPEEGSLRHGVTYTCSFKLGKALGLASKELQTMEFSFYSPKKIVSIECSGLLTNENTADVSGTLSVNGEGDYGLSVSAEGKEAAITKTSAYEYAFELKGIERGPEDKIIKIKTSAQAKDLVLPAEKEFTIPGTKVFKVVDAKLVNSDTPYILVTFSEPLAPIPAGLVDIKYADGTSFTRKGNTLKVYYEAIYGNDITLQLDGNIKCTRGDALGQDLELPVAKNMHTPAVKIAANGNIVPDANNVLLPFKSINLMAVDVKIIKVYENNILSFLQENAIDGTDRVRRSGRLVYANTIRLDTDPELDLHSWQNFSLDLSGMFKKEPGAIYIVHFTFCKDYSLYGKTGPVESAKNTFKYEPLDDSDWDTPRPYYWSYWGDDMDWSEYNWEDMDNPETPSYYMLSERFPTVNLIASDIGLIAKSSDAGKLWVTAASLKTSAPVSGADVNVYNFQLQKIGKGKTSSDGLTEINVKGVPFVVTASKDGSTSYLRILNGEQNSLSRFDTGGRKLEKGLKAYIFGERGIWRPGDTLHLTMLLQDKGANLPDAHPVAMDLYTPSGQFYAKQINADGNDGFYRFDIPTKDSDPTGIWYAYFKVGGRTFQKNVRIETIKPNRLKINTSVGDGLLSAGTQATVKMASSWLTGPAAKGLKAKLSMYLSKNGSHFKDFKGYTFSNPLLSFNYQEIDLLDTRLGQNGTTTASIRIPEVNQAPGMLNATLISTVTENGGDESITSSTVPFSPYESYVGIKAPEAAGFRYETGKDIDFSVIDVDKDGKKVSGHKLEYTIYKLGWSWWWENGTSDLYAYVNSSSAKVISAGSFTSSSSPSKVTLRVEYPDWGRYLIYIKDTDSGHATGETMVVDWPDYMGRADRKDPDALNMLTFSLDKEEYAVGENASVFIPAAAGNGNALVSLENGSGVIDSKWVKLSGKEDTVYKFKVQEEMAPNFFVHISLVQPYGNVENDLPIRLYGVQPVLVSNKESVLKPVIKMADSIHPEEKFSLSVSEANGKKMTYMIAIVDEGLLALTSFKTPDPWNYMYSKEAIGVNTWDLYDKVMGSVGGKFGQMLSVGGDEDLSPGEKRGNRFNPVVKVMGPFYLAKGTDKHEIQLPMYVGQVRVMVIAAHDGAYGNAEKAVAVKSPLMAVTTLPRVLGIGDEISVPVNVFALEDGIGNVDVSVHVTGAASITGASKNTISFSAPGDKITEFKIKGTGEGTAQITVQAASAGHKTKETFNLPVRNSNKAVVNVSYHTVAAGKSVTLAANGNRKEGTVIMSSFPAIDYVGATSYAINYPYSCSEQLASRGLVLLHSIDKLPADKAEPAKAKLMEIIGQLYGRQLPDGGFAYWSGSIASDTWVSSMAGVLLSEARAKGLEVSKEVIGSWLKYQKNAVKNYRSSASKNLNDLDQAFRLYSLAVSGNADDGAANRLKEAAQTSAQAKWMLSSVYSLSGKKKVALDLIASIESGFADYDAHNFTYGSEYRDKAIATEALALAGKAGEAISSAHQIASVFGPGYSNTQESAFAAMALDRVYAVTGGASLDVKLAGSTTEDINISSGIQAYTLKKEDKDITITNQSSGPVYIAFSQTVQPEPGTALAAKSSGLKLSVVYMASDGSTISPASIRQGTDFTAVIQVINTGVSQDYDNIALYAAIPAGWEISSDRLFQDNVASANAYDNLDIRDDAAIWYFNLARGTSKTFKLKLRAAYEGTYVLPSITCEQMYNALITARTASGKTVVTK